jgi:hypothetical protein
VSHDDLRIAAEFVPPSAHARYERWREVNAELLNELSPDDVRLDVGRASSGGDFVRVWLPPDVLADVRTIPLSWPCVCCGCFTLPEPTGTSDEICPVCYWQDDAVDNRDTDVLGPNRVRLSVARANYERFGAHEERWLPHVRLPRTDELPPPPRPVEPL